MVVFCYRQIIMITIISLSICFVSSSTLVTNHCQQFHNLYLSHHAWLINWLRRRLAHAEQVEDLAQDTFMQLLGRQQLIADLQQPKAWLSTVAHGLLVDKIRREKVEQNYLKVISQLPENHAPSPEIKLLLLEALAQLDILLDGLAPKARLAFLLSRLEGLTYKEIAQQLNVSLSSVEKYMASAIKHCFKLQMSWKTTES